MNKIGYNNKKFASVQNSETGDISSETIFHYHQEGNLVWAEYSGGEIVFGNLVAKADENGNLDMRYQHLNRLGELMTGICKSTPKLLKNRKIRLYEKWRWTNGDLSEGESIIEQVK